MTRTARIAKLPATKSRADPRAGPAPRSTVIRAIPLLPKASGPAWPGSASDPLAGGRTGSGETHDHMPSSRPPIQPRATGMHANRLASPHPRAAQQCRRAASGFRSAIASPGPWRSRPLREERSASMTPTRNFPARPDTRTRTRSLCPDFPQSRPRPRLSCGSQHSGEDRSIFA